MKITTLENDNRALELDDQEYSHLMWVLNFLKEYYDEFNITVRMFSREEVDEAIKIFAEKRGVYILPPAALPLLTNVLGYVDYLIDDTDDTKDDLTLDVIAEFAGDLYMLIIRNEKQDCLLNGGK